MPALASALGDPDSTRRLSAFLEHRNLGPQRAVEAIERYLNAEADLGRLSAQTDTHAVAVALLGMCEAVAVQARLAGRGERWARAEAARAVDGLTALIRGAGAAATRLGSIAGGPP